MGSRVLNFNVICDFATPEKNSSVELHMELPVPYSDVKILQTWFDKGEWATAENYLIQKYPEHRNLLKEWMIGCKRRSENDSTSIKLAAVG
ncbi:hypothetical protein [Paenochrobactrum pullorum]|uniref:hypothetical protein n=1 Tax=Paenochrobactrum pullorum TaxID=1324351 RepID=UPI0035BBABC1